MQPVLSSVALESQCATLYAEPSVSGLVGTAARHYLAIKLEQ